MPLLVSTFRSVYHTLVKNKSKEDIRLFVVEIQHLLDGCGAVRAEEDCAGVGVTQGAYYLPQ